MSYIIKNRAKQPIICTMGDGESLRLPIGEEIEVTKKQFRGHLETLLRKGDISLVKEVVPPKTPEMKVVKATVEQTGQQNKKGGK